MNDRSFRLSSVREAPLISTASGAGSGPEDRVNSHGHRSFTCPNPLTCRAPSRRASSSMEKSGCPADFDNRFASSSPIASSRFDSLGICGYRVRNSPRTTRTWALISCCNRASSGKPERSKGLMLRSGESVVFIDAAFCLLRWRSHSGLADLFAFAIVLVFGPRPGPPYDEPE
jgi:hypothetical protein